MDRTIYQETKFRIVEIADHTYTLEDLKGDCFCPDTNTEIDVEELKKQERDFEVKVEREGVYGYSLEVWNPEVGHGWEHVDSCFGFIGQYDSKTNDHYIVDEFIEQTYSFDNV